MAQGVSPAYWDVGISPDSLRKKRVSVSISSCPMTAPGETKTAHSKAGNWCQK